ncbi:hypothetical protein [Streptomyces sp. NPDC059906]|uniref:hypothetical protein n=1 Tax=Streptomyces sp. NPDC059906 TaxID=3346997 RepID=UPI0036482490
MSRLKDSRFDGYLRHPPPHERDAIVDAMITSYRKGPAPVRQRAIDDLDARSASVPGPWRRLGGGQTLLYLYS